jgi:hypothetical protein
MMRRDFHSTSANRRTTPASSSTIAGAFEKAERAVMPSNRRESGAPTGSAIRAAKDPTNPTRILQPHSINLLTAKVCGVAIAAPPVQHPDPEAIDQLHARSRRHVSSGAWPNKPSREMVHRLAAVLDVPLRHSNELLLVAGPAFHRRSHPTRQTCLRLLRSEHPGLVSGRRLMQMSPGPPPSELAESSYHCV